MLAGWDKGIDIDSCCQMSSPCMHACMQANSLLPAALYQSRGHHCHAVIICPLSVLCPFVLCSPVSRARCMMPPCWSAPLACPVGTAVQAWQHVTSALPAVRAAQVPLPAPNASQAPTAPTLLALWCVCLCVLSMERQAWCGQNRVERRYRVTGCCVVELMQSALLLYVGPQYWHHKAFLLAWQVPHLFTSSIYYCHTLITHALRIPPTHPPCLPAVHALPDGYLC